MEIVGGERPGSEKYFYTGYAYYCDRTSVGHMIYRCALRSTRKCSGTIRMKPNEVFEVLKTHTHPPKPHIAEEARMNVELLRMCRESLQSYCDIFRDVSLRYAQAAVNVTLQSVRRSMEQERSRTRPRIPNDLAGFDAILGAYITTHDIYRGLIRATDGSVAIAFGHLRMLERLNRATEIFIDATFRVVPKKPEACQLLIIHIRSMDVAFPVLYALCSRRTKQLYIAVWRWLINLVPGLQDNLRTIISDYEKAILGSVREVFPGVTLRGCWFHFCQALQKRWRKLHLTPAPPYVLWMSMSLPLIVPTARFLEGLNLGAEIGNGLANEYPAITQFFEYMRRQWQPLADVVAVGGAALRTNNICETFHRHIIGKLGGCSHPNIWILFERLDSLIRNQEIDWQRVHGGRPITRGSTHQQMAEDARIMSLQDELTAENITLRDFLRGIMEHRRRAAANAEQHP